MFVFQIGYPKLCTRCLKQEAKLQEGDIDCISKYCPLDLFSGDLGRMKRALFDLYESPHNRFKVFKNGQLIYTEKIGEKDELEETLSQFFERQEGINTLASVLCSTLLGKCFFRDILVRCGRVVTDFLPYPKFSKSLPS